MCTFRDVISGDGFLAGVTVQGRIMAAKDDGEWWMDGVRPAGITEKGETLQEAFLHFRDRFKKVLFDIAEESLTFELFRTEVERFFYELDAEEEHRWSEAFKLIRTGKVVPEHPFSELPKAAPESRPSSITVEQLDVTKRFMASDNVPDAFMITAPLAA
jgi:predicted RNase H-like HicB family nuclease